MTAERRASDTSVGVAGDARYVSPTAEVQPPTKHDRAASPHSALASFTCSACVVRCIADGPEAVKQGRDYITRNAERWAQEDGYVG